MDNLTHKRTGKRAHQFVSKSVDCFKVNEIMEIV